MFHCNTREPLVHLSEERGQSDEYLFIPGLEGTREMGVGFDARVPSRYRHAIGSCSSSWPPRGT